MIVRTCKDTGQIKPEGFLKQTGKTLLGAWVFAANHKGLTTLHTPHLLCGFYVGTQFSCLSSVRRRTTPKPLVVPEYMVDRKRRFGLRTAHPHHSSAYAAVPRTSAHRRAPLQSVRGREEVSLCPCSIVAPCLPQQGQWNAWIAPACAIVAPHHSSLRRTGCCTRCVVYGIVKVQWSYGANCSSIVLMTQPSSADTRDIAFFRTLICSAHSVCSCG